MDEQFVVCKKYVAFNPSFVPKNMQTEHGLLCTVQSKIHSIRTSVCYRAVTQWFVVYSIKQDSLNQD